MTGPANSPLMAHLELRSFETELPLPFHTDVLRAREPEPLADVRAAVLEALAAPIGSASLAETCNSVLARAARAARPAFGARPARSVVVVVSDNTRPAPYKGEGGILWPLVEILLSSGIPPESVTLLVASGTHRVLSDEEIWALFDERVRQAGVRVRCHNAADSEGLTSVGRRENGDEVFVNRAYVEADLRILTGLVEPHLMAGFSGGRKSICPGLLSVRSVREFHGAKTLAHPKATGLVLEGNPCHEVSLEIARMVRPDFILNATIRQDGRVAGVFAGEMEQAHQAAAEQVRDFAQIPLERRYDVVVTHGGLVGINHYQVEKAADVARLAVEAGGYVVVVADTTDADPVGTESYRRMLKLLAEVGVDEFLQAIKADDWEFVHDQWGVQVWAHLLVRVPREHVFYFSPQTPLREYTMLPCVDPRGVSGERLGFVAGEPGELVARFAAAAVARACRECEAAAGRPATVAYLADGPRGIPVGPGPAGE
jgi:hypothetical protein